MDTVKWWEGFESQLQPRSVVLGQILAVRWGLRWLLAAQDQVGAQVLLFRTVVIRRKESKLSWH